VGLATGCSLIRPRCLLFHRTRAIAGCRSIEKCGSQKEQRRKAGLRTLDRRFRRGYRAWRYDTEYGKIYRTAGHFIRQRCQLWRHDANPCTTRSFQPQTRMKSRELQFVQPLWRCRSPMKQPRWCDSGISMPTMLRSGPTASEDVRRRLKRPKQSRTSAGTRSCDSFRP